MRAAWIALSLLMLSCGVALSQSSAPPPKACSTAEFRQFDFWVGDWDLTWPGKSGQPPQNGHNRIESELGQCVIQEHFSDRSEPPFEGTSISTFTPALGKWQQTWVDNQGAYLDFIGEFKDGQMILSREATGADGKKFQQRMVFKNIKPDSLDWSWERSDDGGATWKVIWPVHYQRRKSLASAKEANTTGTKGHEEILRNLYDSLVILGVLCG